jgi:hypothetical protein
MNLVLGLTVAVFGINLPFGYLRARTRRFSRAWFVAIHAPIPLVVAMRFLSGLGWRPITVPIFAGAFFAGQYLGGRLHAWRRRGVTVR